MKFGREDIVKRFLQSGRTGFYVAVLREGEVAAGDGIERIGRDRNSIPVPDITRLYITRNYSHADLQILQRATQLEALPESWREYFREKLNLVTRKSK